MIFVRPICFSCIHYNIEKGNCKAFPNEIPDIIYTGDNRHSEPLPEQKNDIIFTPKDNIYKKTLINETNRSSK